MMSRMILVLVWLVSAIPAFAEAAPAPSPAAARPSGASRPDGRAPAPRSGKDLGTLDEITIEGEIAAPQVLFITARDRARFFDPNHRLYLKSCSAWGRETSLPLPRCLPAAR
jgi:hypothetical protein